MQRQLNIRFLGILLVAAIVLGVGGFFLHRLQAERNAGYLLARGERAEQEGDASTAIDYFARYLAYRPGDSAARARFGGMLADRARTRRQKEQAMLALERAVRDDPGQATARRRIVDLAMELRRYPDAKVHLDALLRDQKENPELHELLGRCAEEAGQPKEAIPHYQEAVKYGPTRIDAHVRLADLYLRSNQVSQADQVMGLLAVGPNQHSVPARLARVRYFRGQDRLDEAGKDLAVVQAGPGKDDPEVWLAAADLALARSVDSGSDKEERKKQVAAARAYFERGLGTKDYRFYTGLARLELQQRNRARAAEILRTAADLDVKDETTRWALADTMLSTEDGEVIKAAQGMIEQLRSGNIRPSFVDYLDARVKLRNGAVRQAAELLERCRTDFARQPELAISAELLLASCAEKLGQTDQQVAACRRAVDIDASSPLARQALANALLAAGEFAEADKIYQSLLGRIDDVRFVLARIRIHQALRAPAGRRDFTDAAILLDGTPDALKEMPQYVLARAELLLAQGKRDEARAVVEAARDKEPGEILFWLGLASIARTDPAAEAKILADAEAKLGNRADLRLARASLLTRQGAKPDALKPLEAGSESLPAADRDRLQLGLADAYRRLGSLPDAERLLREVAGRRPDDPAVLARLFDIVALRNDAAAVADVAVKLSAAEGEQGATWRFADAYRHWLSFKVDRNPVSLKAARERLQEARKQRPNWFRIPLLEAEIADNQRQIELAIEKYQQALRLGVRDPGVIRRAVDLLSDRRRFDEAQEALNAFRGAELPPELAKEATELSFERAVPAEESIRLAEKAVSRDAKNPRDQLWLARVYWRAGKLKEAEAAFRTAIELDRQSPEAWVSLVAFLARADRAEDARAEVENARRAVPPEKHALLLAPSYEALGDREKAEAAYADLLKQSPGDAQVARSAATFFMKGGEAAKAEPLLRQIITSPAATPDLRHWARRTLAIASVIGGDYRKSTQALALLEENLLERPDSPDDLNARALINAARPGGRKQSIRDLEKSFSLRPSDAEEFLLARLYDLDGDWLKARERMENLLTREGGRNNPTYLGYFIRALIRRDDLPTAGVWLARLESLDGRKGPSPLAVELRARLLARLGKEAEAGTLLKDFARAKSTEGKGDVEVLGRVGMLLHELKLNADAEAMLRQYVSLAGPKKPGAVLVLVEFLSRVGRTSEALNVCAGAMTAVGPEIGARFVVSAIRRSEPVPAAADLARAEELLAQAVRTKPDSLDLQISLADFRDAQGRYSEAIQIYRTVLSRDPNNDLALNNLAWLVHFHEKNSEEALGLINRAIENLSPVADLLDTRGVIRLGLGQTRGAIADLGEAVSQSPGATTYFHLAAAHHRAGQSREARIAFRQAVENQLTRESLHRLEWPVYEQLQKEFGGK